MEWIPAEGQRQERPVLEKKDAGVASPAAAPASSSLSPPAVDPVAPSEETSPQTPPFVASLPPVTTRPPVDRKPDALPWGTLPGRFSAGGFREATRSHFRNFWSTRFFGIFAPYHLLLLLIPAFALFAVVDRPELFDSPAFILRPNQNSLLLGESSTIKRVELPFEALSGSNRLSKAEIYTIRRNYLSRFPELLKTAYVPDEAVFGTVRDSEGWFGTVGFYFHGPGSKAFEGPPAEGKSIANPLLLIVPEFWGLSIWERGSFIWRRAAITPSDLAQADFPYYPSPTQIVYKPREALIEVDYDITAFTISLNRWTTRLAKPTQATFGITAFNARDFGMRYIALNLAESENIANPSQGPVPINDSLTYYNFLCGPETGCNHRSNADQAFDEITLTKLPASAVFYLWMKEPKGMAAPDAKYIIRLK